MLNYLINVIFKYSVKIFIPNFYNKISLFIINLSQLINKIIKLE
ncbi:hypothetical protein N008_00025 [Hymenobacter sp. APR13]|nr:hypothetical protein N008_00025 [Hymenobacter sp. APR13]